MKFCILLLLWPWIFLVECARYGVAEERCPVDASEPERDKAGNVIWCKQEEECSGRRKCVPSGSHHFGQPINYCCPTKASLCSLTLNPGYGECASPAVVRFYFDSMELRCKPFLFIECKGGNDNRFTTIEECEQFCQSTACDAGESLQTSSLSVAASCAVEPCPTGFRCVYDQLFRRHVCCGRVKKEVCPAGFVVYTDENTLKIQRCRPSSIADHCPPDFFCLSAGHIGYCCSPERDVCPFGHRPYEHPLTKKSIKCDPMRMENTCPNGHTCFPIVPGAVWGACCAVEINAQCPSESTPYLESVSRQPVKCTVGITICPNGFVCLGMRPTDIVGFCCQRVETSTYIPRRTIIPGIKYQSDLDAENEIDELFTNLMTGSHEAVENHKPERRIIDIQKEIDASTPTLTTRRRKEPSTYIIPPPRVYLECPEGGEAVYYPGSQLIFECSSTTVGDIACPESADCVPAMNDIFGRSVCCVFKVKTTTTTTTTTAASTTEERYLTPEEDFEEEEEVHIEPQFIYTVTLRSPSPDTERTTDPFCPKIIAGRDCSPGANECPEYKFFCQFNIQFKSFKCCTMNPDA